MSEIWLFLILLLSVLPAIYKIFRPQIKGLIGEQTIATILTRLPRTEYVTFNNVALSNRGRRAQIDHLVISDYGIFVIETKNYKGWIFGDEYGEYWMQVIYKWKKKFYNPIRQNYGHIMALKYHLQDYPHIKYISIAVFSTRAKLKVRTTSEVTYSVNLLNVIRAYNDVVLTEKEKTTIVERIKSISNKGSNKRHQNVQTLCPQCGGELISRIGKYGRFKGCSNFPKCRFTFNG